MTLEIGLLIALIVGMIYLFLTEKIPIDLTAFLGLAILILTGYLSPEEGFSGFSSPAVITMLSIFVVGGALLQTGVADQIGGRIHELVGSREIPLIAAVMVVVGLLSAFMPDITATAILMPAVASIARRAGLSPARLYMPLTFGSILGGTTTLVGTPPNIVASDLLSKQGFAPFSLFAFTPIGIALLASGILFMATVGRRLLPMREIRPSAERQDLAKVYQLHDKLFSIHLPENSRLDGLTIGQARIGTTLGVKVIAIVRNGRRQLAPDADAVLRGGDLLFVSGQFSDLQELIRASGIEIIPTRFDEIRRYARGVSAIRMRLVEGSPLLGKTLKELHFKERYGVIVAGIHRGSEILRGYLSNEILREGDEILALGTRQHIADLSSTPDFIVREVGITTVRELQEHLFLIRVPKGSPLAGTTLGSGRVGELVGLTVVGIMREGEGHLAFSPDEVIREGDRFLVSGEPSRILDLLEIGEVHLEHEVQEAAFESDEVGIVEAAVAPRSRVVGRTLAELRFRERYGLIALSIWREGKPIHTDLTNYPLRFGDALLLQGPRERIRQLALEPDFIVLSQAAQAPRRTKKAPVAIASLLLMIGMVVTGLQPIHVAAFSAATLIMLSGALRMDEAYHAIEWRVIFLIAAVLPVGIAMERTGAALLLANSVAGVAGRFGPHAVLGALILLSSLLSQGLDGAPAVVLLAPVAFQLAGVLDLSPYPLMMGVGLAASCAFMTPFSHKSNLLVMGAGGYRTIDYLRVGTPLTIVFILILILLVPVFFPF